MAYIYFDYWLSDEDPKGIETADAMPSEIDIEEDGRKTETLHLKDCEGDINFVSNHVDGKSGSVWEIDSFGRESEWPGPDYGTHSIKVTAIRTAGGFEPDGRHRVSVRAIKGLDEWRMEPSLE
jgi:hypothetical protein